MEWFANYDHFHKFDGTARQSPCSSPKNGWNLHVTVTTHFSTIGNYVAKPLQFRIINYSAYLPLISNPAALPVNWTNILTEDFEGVFPGSS